MQNLTGLFRDGEAARLAVLALQEAGFSGARIMRPELLENIRKQQFAWKDMQSATELDKGTTELVPVQMKVVYPYDSTVERILRRMGALGVAKLSPEAR